MGELREIVDLAAVERLFLVLAVLGPLLGLGIGVGVGRSRNRVRQSAVTGLLLGLLGTLNWLLWRVYNTLTEANGLDSVKNLAINLLLFVVIGAALGGASVWWQRRTAVASPPDEKPSENAP